MKHDYKCPECNFVEEKSHKINEDPEYSCPDCGMPMKKYFGGMKKTEGFVLRGNSWERDGYQRGG